MPSPSVLFDPNPMCFGATSAMLHILEHLKDVDVMVLATGSSRQLATLSNATVIDCDVKNPLETAHVVRSIGHPQIYVSISNLTNIGSALSWPSRLVYVDILFWMSKGANAAMAGASQYLIEDFPGVQENLDLLIPAISKPRVVPPLINRHYTSDIPRTRSIVINLGGAESPLLRPGWNTDYPAQVVDLIMEWAADHGSFDGYRVHIGAGQQAVRSIHEYIQLPDWIEVNTYPLKTFNQMIRTCSVFITAPGLNAPYEAFGARTPVVFIPPLNFTQVFQLRVYEDHGIQQDSRMNLEALALANPLNIEIGERKGTAIVLDQVRRIFKSDRARNAMKEGLSIQFERATGVRTRLDLLDAQDRFLDALGTDGAALAAAVIREELCALQP